MQNLLSKRHASLLNLHLKVLIAILLASGVAITAYQIFVQGHSRYEAETDDLSEHRCQERLRRHARNPGQGADSSSRR
ncbi:hypothetical protein ACPA9J_08580 [Pseudomonas aeruginosa]